MSIIRQKIKFIPNTNQNIRIFLEEDVNLSGLQDDIDDFVAEETGLSINDTEDQETFRYTPDDTFTMKVYFWSGSTFSPSYEQAGFTTGETSTRDEVILRSFYVMQIYDSVLTENQTLLHTGYYNGYNFIQENDTDATYYFYPEDEDEFANLYIPQWFIDSMTGDTVDLYGKLSFYNAKTGELQLFSQKFGLLGSYELPTVDEDMYFTITLSASTFSYDPTSLYAHELKNTDYVDKINETIDSFDNQKPTYPTGDTFLNTGRYVNEEDI